MNWSGEKGTDTEGVNMMTGLGNCLSMIGEVTLGKESKTLKSEV